MLGHRPRGVVYVTLSLPHKTLFNNKQYQLLPRGVRRSAGQVKATPEQSLLTERLRNRLRYQHRSENKSVSIALRRLLPSNITCSPRLMSSKGDNADIEKLKLVVTIWQQSIDATKHFTEISERTRRMGMTGAVGGIALAATLLTQFSSAKLTFIFDGYEYGIHAAGLIVFASALVVYVTKLLDVGLYHRMTRGSVAFTQAVEQSKQFKEIIDTPRGLAGSISFHSRANAQSLMKMPIRQNWLEKRPLNTSCVASIIFLFSL